MTADQPSDAAAEVVRDTRVLADFIKSRNLRVLHAMVRPHLEVTFFARGERDTITVLDDQPRITFTAKDNS